MKSQSEYEGDEERQELIRRWSSSSGPKRWCEEERGGSQDPAGLLLFVACLCEGVRSSSPLCAQSAVCCVHPALWHEQRDSSRRHQGYFRPTTCHRERHEHGLSIDDERQALVSNGVFVQVTPRHPPRQRSISNLITGVSISIFSCVSGLFSRQPSAIQRGWKNHVHTLHNSTLDRLVECLCLILMKGTTIATHRALSCIVVATWPSGSREGQLG